MLVRLKRAPVGDALASRRGLWQAYRMSDTAPTVVFFTCPLCCSIGSITVPVTADGMVTTLVGCSNGQCGFGDQVHLAGWAEMNRNLTPPPPPFVRRGDLSQ